MKNKNNKNKNMNIKRPRLNIIEIKNSYSDIIGCLNKNDSFACQFEDGVTVHIEKIGDYFDGIMVNTHNYKKNGITTWRYKEPEFLQMYDDILSNVGYKFFSVEKGELLRIRTIFESVTEALMCLKTGKSYGDYRMRQSD